MHAIYIGSSHCSVRLIIYDSVLKFSAFDHNWGPQGFQRSGENGYLFSGSWGGTGNYFQRFGEQAHSFGDLGGIKLFPRGCSPIPKR